MWGEKGNAKALLCAVGAGWTLRQKGKNREGEQNQKQKTSANGVLADGVPPRGNIRKGK